MRTPSLTRWISIVAALVLVAAACGGDSETLTVGEYATAMQAVEDRFDERSDAAGEPGDYAVGGDLMFAADLYAAFQERLAGWQAIQPPADLAAHHEALVAALDAVQQAVGDYLSDEAITNADFDFDTVGPKVNSLLLTAHVACGELRTSLRDVGADVRFSTDCGF